MVKIGQYWSKIEFDWKISQITQNWVENQSKMYLWSKIWYESQLNPTIRCPVNLDSLVNIQGFSLRTRKCICIDPFCAFSNFYKYNCGSRKLIQNEPILRDLNCAGMTRPFIIGCWRELTNVSDCQPLQSLSLILVTDRTHNNWTKSEQMSYLYCQIP